MELLYIILRKIVDLITAKSYYYQQKSCSSLLYNLFVTTEIFQKNFSIPITKFSSGPQEAENFVCHNRIFFSVYI